MTQRIVVPGFNEQDAAALALLWYCDPWTTVSLASPLPWLWLVAPEPYWSWEGQARGPLLLEVGRVLDREPKSAGVRAPWRNELRPAQVPVLLDSGAFSMISKHGRWIRTPEEHVAAAVRICRALGTVQHVATQDWMCEADMLRLTGLSVAEHQRRTVDSMLFCRDSAPELPWMPALQGFTVDDYLRCADLYAAAGVDLAALPLVGLGSVCRRSGTRELEHVIGELARRLPGVQFHGYGVKSDGTLLSCLDLRSVDSDAWSERGRWIERDIRTALGLPAKARWPAVREAVRARGDAVDLDLIARFEWSEEFEQGPVNLQNSLLWAEAWRAAQQERIAVEAMVRAARVAEATFPGQLRLKW